MLSDSKKISIRQATFIFLTVIFSPAIRVIPVIAAKQAKQAAWLAPVTTVIILALLVLVWQALYKKYNNFSLIDIYSDIAGKFIGKTLCIIHLLWVTLLIALYTRYFAIRMVGSIYPNVNLSIFMVSMLMLVAYASRFGLVTLARLNEIIFPLLVVVFCVLFLLLLPSVKVGFLTPITYRSIIPSVRAGIGISGIIAYFTFVFIVGDKINNKESVKKAGLQTSIFLLVSYICLIVATVGTFSHTITRRTQLPFLIAIKQISLFNTLEKIESIVVALWISSDFVLICFFVLLALHLMKSLFKFSDGKPLLGIFMIFIYILSLYLADSVFEMEELSSNLVIPVNIILGFLIPVFMLIVGKIRKKV